MLKICISGSKGKMGARISALAKNDSRLKISGEFDIGQDAEPFIKGCDCFIEFTSPQATMEHLALCRKYKKGIVIGTTGLSESDQKGIEDASRTIPVVLSPNMSIGVNLLFRMAGEAAKALSPEYGVSIVETHHVHKKDSPSGTAKELAKAVRASRPGADIPIQSIREDEIVGDHTVTFESPFDTITISHSAKTRDIFAKGALAAAKFISMKKSGLFSMKDVLSF